MGCGASENRTLRPQLEKEEKPKINIDSALLKPKIEVKKPEPEPNKDDENDLEVIIKTFNKGKRTFNVFKTSTLLEIKQKIAIEFKIPIERQLISLLEKDLTPSDNDKTLTDLGLSICSNTLLVEKEYIPDPNPPTYTATTSTYTYTYTKPTGYSSYPKVIFVKGEVPYQKTGKKKANSDIEYEEAPPIEYILKTFTVIISDKDKVKLIKESIAEESMVSILRQQVKKGDQVLVNQHQIGDYHVKRKMWLDLTVLESRNSQILKVVLQKISDGQTEKEFEVNLRADTQISGVKQIIRKRDKCALQILEVVYKHEELENHNSFFDYHIPNNSTLQYFQKNP